MSKAREDIGLHARDDFFQRRVGRDVDCQKHITLALEAADGDRPGCALDARHGRQRHHAAVRRDKAQAIEVVERLELGARHEHIHIDLATSVNQS